MAGQKEKKPFYKKWWVWVLAVIIVIGLSSGGGEEETAEKVESNNNATETSASPETEEVEQSKEEPVSDLFAVGEAVQLGDNVLTVTNVERSLGTDFVQPKEGMEYIIVTVQIENAGEENISYNPFDFKMANSQGQIVDQAFTIVNTDTALESGELASGGNVTGTIAFEQPAGDAGLQLQYSPSFWSDKTIKVNLQ